MHKVCINSNGMNDNHFKSNWSYNIEANPVLLYPDADAWCVMCSSVLESALIFASFVSHCVLLATYKITRHICNIWLPVNRVLLQHYKLKQLKALASAWSVHGRRELTVCMCVNMLQVIPSRIWRPLQSLFNESKNCLKTHQIFTEYHSQFY